MEGGFIRFDRIPEIGFAHHFYTEKYRYVYTEQKKSFEIVYVNTGGITAELYGQKIEAPQGSVFVLFRHLPFTLTSIGNQPQAHCTVQAEFPYDFRLVDENVALPSDGVFLPFVTSPGTEAEEIKKELYAIVSDIGTSREENGFSAALRFLGIMRRLDGIGRRSRGIHRDSASVLSYKIKKYVAQNIRGSISLQDIGDLMGKTPNYLNHVFKETNGITINQYIARERVERIAELMKTRGLSFGTACENVGVTDVFYGYRLFKKHMGVTPGEFMRGDTHR